MAQHQRDEHTNFTAVISSKPASLHHQYMEAPLSTSAA